MSLDINQEVLLDSNRAWKPCVLPIIVIYCPFIMASASYQGEVKFGKTVFQEGNTFLVKPLALDIAWGGEPRYWSIPKKVKAKGSEPVELLRVSWLEATGSLSLRNFIKGQEYTISFMVSMKPDAFGWEESPVYLMAKPGENKRRSWMTSSLSSHESGCTFFIPGEKALSFKVPEDAKDDDKLLFGIYEIWKGRWKGGLVIHEVIITPA